jgi:hypothetical protein
MAVENSLFEPANSADAESIDLQHKQILEPKQQQFTFQFHLLQVQDA